MKPKKRILFFIGALVSGGKERRLVELLSYLKKNTDFELMLVTTGTKIHYQKFHDLEIPHVLAPAGNIFNTFLLIIKLFSVYRSFKPDVFHSWGRMQTLYLWPFVVLTKAKLVNSQITNAPKEISSINKAIDWLNFKISDVIISNSYAGLASYNPPKGKSIVIRNGMRMERFTALKEPSNIKTKYGIHTPFSIIMVATHSVKKNYQLFFEVGKQVLSYRKDVTFVSAGWFSKDEPIFQRNQAIIQDDKNIIVLGEIQDVESLVNSMDIGILFSTDKFGEGLSNSILEYMALGKPTISTSDGGSKEIVIPNETGFLVGHKEYETIPSKINWLLDHPEERERMGHNAKKMILENFTIEMMGKRYLESYQNIF